MIKKTAFTGNIIPEIVPLNQIQSSDQALSRFAKITEELRNLQKEAGTKQIAEKVDDFLYAHCIMMHAAEASLLDAEGNALKNARGEPVRGGFVPCTDHKGMESIRWESPDNIQMYKNANGDIFPEAELIKAHKNWIGKPLCRDHVSNVIEGVRGIIVDTYYDPKFKRVHALFALDRKNYSDLARKVEAGYATNVSMGTGVGRSICSTCGNVATVESEYCSHVKTRQCFGEVNLDLSPIELSIVVTGADPNAKIKTVLAHLKDYQSEYERLSKEAGDKAKYEMARLQKEISLLKKTIASEELDVEEFTLVRRILGSNSPEGNAYKKAKEQLLAMLDKDVSSVPSKDLVDLAEVLNNKKDAELADRVSMIVLNRGHADGEEGQFPVPSQTNDSSLGLVDTDGSLLKSDQDLVDQGIFDGGAGDPLARSAPGAAMHNFSYLYQNNGKTGALGTQVANNKKEKNMSFSELKGRSTQRLAYMQGTEEPKKYAPMGDADKIRDTQDKHMTGDMLDTKSENPDMEEKKILQRAELESRMAKRSLRLQKYKTAANAKVLSDSSGKAAAIEEDGKVRKLQQNAKDKLKEKLMKEKEKEKALKEKEKEKAKKTKKAYMQGTEEPQKYAPMGDADKIRDTQDKHMTGDFLNTKVENPDEALKKSLQRIAGVQLKARFTKAADVANTSWTILAGTEPVMVVKASAVFGDKLGVKAAGDKTYGDFFTSTEYAQRLLKMVRAAGPEAAAQELGVPDAAVPAAPMAAPAPEAAPEAPAPAADAPVEEVPADDIEKLKEEIAKSVDKLEVAVDEVKSAVSADEGLKDVNVTMPEAGADMGMATAATRDSLLKAYSFLTDSIQELSFIQSKLTRRASRDLFILGRQAVRDAKIAAFEASQMVADYAVDGASEGMEEAAIEGLEYVSHELAHEDSAEVRAEAILADAMLAAVNKAERKAPDHLDDEEKSAWEEAFDGTNDLLHGISGKLTSEMAAKDKMSAKDAKKVEKLKEQIEKLQEELEEAEGEGKHDKKEHAKHEAKESAKEEKEEHEKEEKEADAMDKVAQRKAWRKQLIAQAAEFDPLLDAAHKESNELKFDVKPKDNGAVVETLEEVHEAVMDVATKPVKVREAAEKLGKAIKAGLIREADLGKLVALGSVDAEAVNYWKKYFSQVDGGAEFAKGLVQDFKKSASVHEAEDKAIRTKRAFHLALEAQKRGIIAQSRADLDRYVDTVISLPDEVFNNVKSMVTQTKIPAKTASYVPNVGMYDDQVDAAPRVESTTPTVDALARLFIK